MITDHLKVSFSSKSTSLIWPVACVRCSLLHRTRNAHGTGSDVVERSKKRTQICQMWCWWYYQMDNTLLVFQCSSAKVLLDSLPQSAGPPLPLPWFSQKAEKKKKKKKKKKTIRKVSRWVTVQNHNTRCCTPAELLFFRDVSAWFS